MTPETPPVGLPPEQFAAAFPFHIAVDRALRIVQVGAALAPVCGRPPAGTPFLDVFDVARPRTEPTYDTLAAHADTLFILEVKATGLVLRGQMMPLAEQDLLLFLGSPWIMSVKDARERGLSLGDFALHDAMSEFLILLQAKDHALAEAEQMTERLHVHRSQLREANRRLALEIAEREKAEAALRHSEADYRIVVDSVKEVIFRTDAEARITFLNPAWTDVTGFAVEEGLGKLCMDFAHPDDRERYLPALREHIGRGTGGARVEMRHLTRDGGYRWVEIQAQILCDPSGRVAGLAGTLSDVTARHEHELVLSEANAELARAARMKDQFLASMSHELRTPLNAVLGMSEALAEDTFGPITDQQRKAVGSIEASGRHLLDLINDILDLSKIEAGLFSIEPQPAQVRSLCDSCLMLVRGAAQKKRITLESQVAPDVSFVHADARRLKQSIVNLLGNGIKFTPEGGAVKLSVSLDHDAGAIKFAVSDTGIGIAPENQQRIFAAFVQADSSLSRQYGGSGLGLALVRKMVGLHGGTVSVASALGAGSTFTIALPLHHEGLPAAIGRGPRPRVLIADDDAVTRTLLVRYLEDRGYEPVSCETGRQALAEARRERPAFVLLDVQMPDMDGFEVIRAMRRDAELAHVAICAMSAMLHSVDRDRCLAAGADEFLRKPIDIDRLMEVIAERLPGGAAREVARP